MSPRILLAAVIASSMVHAQDPKLDTFIGAFNDIQRRYVDESKVGTDRLVGEALKGVVNTLDPESLIVGRDDKPAGPADPGLTVGIRDGMVLVLDVAEGSPAEGSGVQPGDRIIRIDGEGAAGKKRAEVERSIRGAAGSRVTLMWADPRNEVREVVLARSPSGRQAWRSLKLDGVLVVQVFRFDAASAAEIRGTLQGIKPGEVAGVLFDVRRSSAGDYDAALELADACFGGNELLAIGQAVNHRYAKTYQAKRKSDWVKLPLVVVAGPYTQGAAELFAAALQDHKRAVVVGNHTFGYASRQHDFELSDGKFLRLTVERFLTPLSLSITGAGLEPDLVVNEAPPGEVALSLARHHIAEKLVERLFNDPPYEYDAEAVQRGELKLGAAALKGKSVIEQRMEFEQAFQIALEALLRDLDLEYDKDDLEEQRNGLISRVRVLLAKARMKPADALFVSLREDRAAVLAADSLRALVRLRAGMEAK